MMTAAWQDYIIQKVIGNTAVPGIGICSEKHRMLCGSVGCTLQDGSNKFSISMLHAKDA